MWQLLYLKNDTRISSEKFIDHDSNLIKYVAFLLVIWF